MIFGFPTLRAPQGAVLPNDVVLLINGAGTPAAPDVSNFGRAFTVTGSPSMTTAQARYGTKSLTGSSSDVMAPSAVVPINSGRWTLRFWAYNTAANALNISIGDGVLNVLVLLNTSRQFGVNANGFGSIFRSSLNSVPLGTWAHYEISVDGTGSGSTNYYAFIDGVLVASGATSAFTLPSAGSDVVIGALGSGLNGWYLDDLEIQSDVCLHTSNFTPPGELAPGTGG